MEIESYFNQYDFDIKKDTEEIEKRVYLTELYVRMNKEKNVYKPSFNYPNAKNGNLEKMIFHLQQIEQEFQGLNGGGPKGKVPKEVNLANLKEKRDKQQIKKREYIRSESINERRINGQYISLIKEIIGDLNISSINDLITLIENIDPIPYIDKMIMMMMMMMMLLCACLKKK